MRYPRRHEGLECSGVFHAPQIGLPRERIAPFPKVTVIKPVVFNEADFKELAKLLRFIEDKKTEAAKVCEVKV